MALYTAVVGGRVKWIVDGYTRPKGTVGIVSSIVPGTVGESDTLWVQTKDGPINVWLWEIEVI